MTALFADDYRETPYWWDRSPPEDRPSGAPPPRADVVVIGAGYTGLHAALVLARAGRDVVVLDAGALGQGCSTRNGGQISHSVKPGMAELTRRHGADTARMIVEDGRASRRFIEDFVTAEGLDCDFRCCGRFHAAHSPRAFADMRAEYAAKAPGVTLIPPDAQREQIGSDYYHGGVVYGDYASVDPGRYHAGLLGLARKAGAQLFAQCPASGLAPDKDGVTVTTPQGQIRARDVVLATNGYSGGLSPWHQRRVIPIGSYIIATEELPAALIADAFPGDRMVTDSRRVVYYYRASPDGRRVIFGGRVSAGETGLRNSARRLHAELLRIFPQFEGCRISHSWMGFVAYSFDELAHIGSNAHVHHAMGYCGSGVGMASYLGMKTGLSILAAEGAETGLQRIGFPTRPMYRGKPWFLPLAVEYYRLRDRLGW